MDVAQFWIGAPGGGTNPELQEVERRLAARGIEFEWDRGAPGWYDGSQRWLRFVNPVVRVRTSAKDLIQRPDVLWLDHSHGIDPSLDYALRFGRLLMIVGEA